MHVFGFTSHCINKSTDPHVTIFFVQPRREVKSQEILLPISLKRTWSRINEITSRKQTSSLVTEVKCNDKTFIDPNQICKVFNELFASIGPKLGEEIPANVTGHSHLDYLTIQNHEHSFQFQESNASAVFSLFSKLC